MSEQALDAHLEQWEQRPEEMVEVERGYLEWLEGRVEQLKTENERLQLIEMEVRAFVNDPLRIEQLMKCLGYAGEEGNQALGGE